MREWRFRAIEDYENEESFLEELDSHIQSLMQETGLSRTVVQLCRVRGLKTKEEIENYLYPQFAQMTDPFSIQDMELLVKKLAECREKNETVLIFGDYDVDGTCGAALFSWCFKDFKIKCEVRQPDRFLEGYGLSVVAVEEAAQKKINTIICVDCGISSFAAIDRANELGIDVLVVDHHHIHPEKGLPHAKAIVNPQREDCKSLLKELCGCGLAFYVCVALRAFGKKNNWFQTSEEIPNLKQHLDLVVLATSADMVPLVKDNRILTSIGLGVLKNTQKPGLKALMRHSGVAHKMTGQSIGPGQLGFTLAPRINASGRLGSASHALQLLISTNDQESDLLALQLEKINADRMLLQNTIWDEVRKKVEDGMAEGLFQNAVVVGAPHWHEGVVGIVASRVVETFHKPAIVLCQREDFAKGSARSYGRKDILSALQKCESLLLGCGGHKMAAGLSLLNENILVFQQAFDQAVSELESQESVPLWVDGALLESEMDLKTLKQLELLGPFGPGNPEPVFVWKAKVLQQQILKGRHLKLKLNSLHKINSLKVDALWFGAAEKNENIEMSDPLEGKTLHIAGVPEINRFQGNTSIQFRIKEMQLLQ